jgi:OOP family OmpA-OmpF porin
MNSAIRITLVGLAAAGMALPMSASAQLKNQGYLTDSRGDIVRAAGAGVCVRTSDWTPARAVAECDPDLVKKAAPKAAAKAPKAAAKPKAKAAAPAKKAKPKLINVEQKIELQGMPFAKAEMTADNKASLDKFLASLRKATKARGPVTFGAVVVTGHTDRIGSLPYNMKLSERRAVVVKDYLVAQNVDQKLIFWEGKAFKQPIPVTKFCDNKMNRKQLIECLSPNRRVTVEIVGRAVNLKPKPKAKPGAKAKPKAKPKR